LAIGLIALSGHVEGMGELIMDARSYHYGEPGPGDFCYHDYLIPAVLSILKEVRPKRIFDLGCGNGLAAHVLATHGYRIVGIDPSEEGINWARAHYPDIEVHQGSANDDLRARFGTFPVVMSLEVVEHIYDPRAPMLGRCSIWSNPVGWR
jgi:2-polyprenyl-6-hydroxyphenyl methylase/3-demethylubiquinone-9 3-methyltransferase